LNRTYTGSEYTLSNPIPIKLPQLVRQLSSPSLAIPCRLLYVKCSHSTPVTASLSNQHILYIFNNTNKHINTPEVCCSLNYAFWCTETRHARQHNCTISVRFWATIRTYVFFISCITITPQQQQHHDYYYCYYLVVVFYYY